MFQHKPARYSCGHKNVKDHLPSIALSYNFICHRCCIIKGKHEAMSSIREHYLPVIDDLVAQVALDNRRFERDPTSWQLWARLKDDKELLAQEQGELERRESVLRTAFKEWKDEEKSYDEEIQTEKDWIKEAEKMWFDANDAVMRRKIDEKRAGYVETMENLKQERKQLKDVVEGEMYYVW